MATSEFSTLEALATLSASIPDWNARLDELNGQIAQRQIELAQLEEHERPPTRSMKNKGSTESLRPKDLDENPFVSQDDTDDIQLSPFGQQSPRSPQSPQKEISPTRPKSIPKPALVTTPPKASSTPRPLPGALNRQSSQPTPPAQTRIGSANLRKRKTESLASGESEAPKYRTRSMIIVYYDSQVQTAFEDMVKAVSGSRNTMRKGKMAAKMAEMRRAAEMEVEGDGDDSSDGEGVDLNAMLNSGNISSQRVNAGQQGHSLKPGREHDGEIVVPKLNYVSTRQMGPPRGGTKIPSFGGGLSTSVSMMRSYRRGGTGQTPDIFDTLDKGLEWCQGQCEHAAHQFLRDGECEAEISGIKRKLLEVKETAENELEKLKKEEALRKATEPDGGKGRELKTPQIRKELSNLKDLQVAADMEVDEDEGVDDLEVPVKLPYKIHGPA